MNPPLRTLRQTCGAPNLLVLLPGAYMTPEDFEKAGFFAAVSQRQLALDIAAVDLDFAAISGGTALPALQAEILEPARQQGYKKIWLGGISLGGLLALCHIAEWQVTPDQLSDPEFRMWRWLQKPPPDFPVFVGYGTEDRFASGMQQIAECFPPATRHALPGDHDWPVWQVLWERFLDRLSLSA